MIMQRYHLPILSLGFVSTLVLYLILTQQEPFIVDTDASTISLNITTLAYFGTAGFLAIFSWVTLGWYVVSRIIRPQWHPRMQTRSGLKAGVLIALGAVCMLLLRVTQTLNIATGIILWLTILSIAWTVKRRE